MSSGKSNDDSGSPYVAFKSDRERKWALVSRDIRLVLIFAFFAFTGAPGNQWGVLLKFIERAWSW